MAKKNDSNSKVLKVTQVRSGAGRYKNQVSTLRGLGLKMGKTVQLTDTPAVRGMIRTVMHLIKVEG